MAGITTAQSGLPFTPTISADTANTGVSSQRPNVIGTPVVIGDPNCWFYISANAACASSAPSGTSAFAVPAQFTYGNGGRNILRADKLVEVNVTATKSLQIAETRAIEFRAEFFNLLNSPAFSAPSTNINVASGAQVGTTLNAARMIELAVKIFF